MEKDMTSGLLSRIEKKKRETRKEMIEKKGKTLIRPLILMNYGYNSCSIVNKPLTILNADFNALILY